MTMTVVRKMCIWFLVALSSMPERRNTFRRRRQMAWVQITEFKLYSLEFFFCTWTVERCTETGEIEYSYYGWDVEDGLYEFQSDRYPECWKKICPPDKIVFPYRVLPYRFSHSYAVKRLTRYFQKMYPPPVSQIDYLFPKTRGKYRRRKSYSPWRYIIVD